jgi:hypothetical protein
MQFLDMQPAIERLYQYRNDLVARAAVQTNLGPLEAA